MSSFEELEHNFYLRIRVRTMIKFKDIISQKLGDVVEVHYQELEELLDSDKSSEQKIKEFKEIMLLGMDENMKVELAQQLPKILESQIDELSTQVTDMLKRAAKRAVDDTMKDFGFTT